MWLNCAASAFPIFTTFHTARVLAFTNVTVWVHLFIIWEQQTNGSNKARTHIGPTPPLVAFQRATMFLNRPAVLEHWVGGSPAAYLLRGAMVLGEADHQRQLRDVSASRHVVAAQLQRLSRDNTTTNQIITWPNNKPIRSRTEFVTPITNCWMNCH